MNIKLNDKNLTCSFCSRIDTPTCSSMEDELDRTIKDNPGATLVFDMKGVEYISSAFLRISIVTAKKAGAEKFRIINAAPAVKKVFKTARLENILNLQ